MYIWHSKSNEYELTEYAGKQSVEITNIASWQIE